MKKYIKTAATVFVFLSIGVLGAKFLLFPFMEWLTSIDLAWWQTSALIVLPLSLVFALPSNIK